MKAKIFVDGHEGTTGLEIYQRLEKRTDIQILNIDSDKRKDPTERAKLINAADIVFLCLPDDAAREAVALVESSSVRIIDSSTAHRTQPGWVYGIPELSAVRRTEIKNAPRVSVPGCYASGFVMSIYPLVRAGILPTSYSATCFALSGYSGAGKKGINQYEQAENAANHDELHQLASPRLYGLSLNHKHLPEMRVHSGLDKPPLFTPIIANIYKGMTVNIPIVPRLLPRKVGPAEIHAALEAHYRGQAFVKVFPYEENPKLDGGFLHARACDDTNRIEIFVFGHEEQILVSARLDNLGKGASGAAVQNMNIMLGLEETEGLET